MAVFKNSRNKNEIIVQCSAYDFDSLQFSVDIETDGTCCMYISTLSANFYQKQENKTLNRLLERLRLVWDILCGKEHRLHEIIINDKDLEDFKKFINNIKKS